MLSRIKFVVVISSTFLTALLVIGAALGDNTSADGAYRQLSVYTEVLSRIKSDYVEEPDIKQVTAGALQGMLESLDPQSCYMTADQYKEYQKLKAAPQQGNVGLVISKRFGIVFILAAQPGSPAAKAGLGIGDQLEAIDSKATRDLPLPLTQALLNGPAGSTVALVVRRNRQTDNQEEITLTRAGISVPAVTGKLLDDKVGYIELRALTPGKAAEAAGVIRDLTRQGAQRLVLDLRGNAVGDVPEGLKLANLFVSDGLLAYLQGQKSPRKDFSADPSQAVTKLPLVVIANRATSGGAEVTAAAILDRNRGKVVGEKTFGLAAEQKTINLDDGAAVILSVAKYYRPAGKAIQDGGVNPTLQVAEVPDTDDDDDNPHTPSQSDKSPENDELLKKAIELVKGAAPTAA